MSLNVCRCCLRPSDIPLESIFNKDCTGIYIAEMISVCASVPILQRDDIPSGICGVCLTELNLSYNFRKKCTNSFNELSHLSNSNVSTITDNGNLSKLNDLAGFEEAEDIDHIELPSNSIYRAEKFLYLLPKYKDKSSKVNKSSPLHKTYKCMNCEIAFHNKSILKKHIKFSHFRYSKCKEHPQTSSKHVRKSQEKKSKSSKRYFPCTPCTKIFHKEDDYKNHMCPKSSKTDNTSSNPKKIGSNESGHNVENITMKKSQSATSESPFKDLQHKFESLQLKKWDISQI